MKYIDLLDDGILNDMFEKIETKDEVYNHGMIHALNVVDNIEKLGKLLNLSDEELNYLKIAGYLHDVGRAFSDENHQIFSKDFAFKYLNSKVDSIWLNKILLAIEKHHEKLQVETLSLFEHILLFSDKMDFSYKRLKVKADCFESNILDIDFDINENKFILECRCIRPFSDEELSKSEKYQKILKRVQEFSSKLNLRYDICFE
ncbi:MAG: HD domain-containing protein [Firmicutes bacterium]|nr:HD domain-containing protein [Bacillota bacterium]